MANATNGTTLPMVRTLAQIHDWRATVAPNYRSGVRIVVSWATLPARVMGYDFEGRVSYDTYG